jgi:acetylornithine deacetylase/succinyl-diaminopimelate desuccinylase-like protein
MLGSPDAKGAGDPPAEFSAGRAMVNVEEVAGEPHPVGSAAMADVADYLAAALERTGAEVDRQDVGDLHNVVARRGTKSTGVTCGLVRCAPPPSAWASFGATEVVQLPAR